MDKRQAPPTARLLSRLHYCMITHYAQEIQATLTAALPMWYKLSLHQTRQWRITCSHVNILMCSKNCPIL